MPRRFVGSAWRAQTERRNDEARWKDIKPSRFLHMMCGSDSALDRNGRAGLEAKLAHVVQRDCQTRLRGRVPEPCRPTTLQTTQIILYSREAGRPRPPGTPHSDYPHYGLATKSQSPEHVAPDAEFHKWRGARRDRDPRVRGRPRSQESSPGYSAFLGGEGASRQLQLVLTKPLATLSDLVHLPHLC